MLVVGERERKREKEREREKQEKRKKDRVSPLDSRLFMIFLRPTTHGFSLGCFH